MKRLVLLFGVLVLSIQPTGCGGDSGSTGMPKAQYSRAEDPNLPVEVREFEAKNAKRLADRAEKTSGGKAAQSAPK
jgi:hypothetical protein